MSISRFLVCVGIITLACLVYVWQNVCQVELSYQLLQQEKEITKLIDQNRALRNSLLQLKSPAAIENRLLASRIELKYTTPVMIAWLNNKIESSPINYSKKSSFGEKMRKVLSAIFVPKSEVEAQP